MQSQAWRIQGVDTGGNDLVLRRIVPWGRDGAVVPASIACTAAPVSGSIGDLLEDNNAQCVFAASDVYAPGFAISFVFSVDVELQGFRFAGPAAQTWPLQHSIAVQDQVCLLGRVQWIEGSLSPAPTQPLNFGNAPVAWSSVIAPGFSMAVGVGLKQGASLLAAVLSNTLHLSVDKGHAWIASGSGARSWNVLGMSYDGSTLFGMESAGSIYVSTDGGATFVARTLPGSQLWRGGAISDDGSLILAASNGGLLYLSRDKGGTWSDVSALGIKPWRGCAISADAKTLVAVCDPGGIFVSKDAGLSWFQAAGTASQKWYQVSVSADGSTILAGSYLSGAALSRDGGASFAAIGQVVGASCFASGVSASGEKMFLGMYGAGLYVSVDQGANWLLQSELGSKAWSSGGISRDGNLFFVCAESASLVLGEVLADPIYLPVPLKSSGWLAPLELFASGSPPLQEHLSTQLGGATLGHDLEFGGDGVIHGTVELFNQAGNLPLPRRVRLHRSRDGLLVRETWSNAQGQYRFEGISQRYTYDVIAWDHEGLQRSVVANDLTPEVLP